jgi:hypothetical protein
VVLAIPRNEELSPEEKEFLEAMSRLTDNPFFQKLAEAVEAERERYISNLARTLAMGSMAPPVDQREIDYKRGFWNGALYAVTLFPNKKAKNWDKFVAETKESETA